MKTIIVFLILFHSLSNIVSAQNKLSYQLTDFGITVNIDTFTWRKVGYMEVKEIAERQKLDLDERLKGEKYIAAFHYIPKDSLNYPPTTFITIEVSSIENKKAGSINIDSINLESMDSFLAKMKGGSIEKGLEKYYFDRYTGTVLFKFLTYMHLLNVDSRKWNENIRLPNHFYIEQSKVVKDKMIRIQFHCYETQQEAYFPKFERIMKSFQ